MTHIEALFAAFDADQLNDELRLVLADALEEAGDERAARYRSGEVLPTHLRIGGVSVAFVVDMAVAATPTIDATHADQAWQEFIPAKRTTMMEVTCLLRGAKLEALYDAIRKGQAFIVSMMDGREWAWDGVLTAFSPGASLGHGETLLLEIETMSFCQAALSGQG